MERDDVIALLDVQRKIFNDVIERLQQEIKVNRDKTNEKIADLVKSLEFSQAEIEDLKKKMETICKEKLKNEREVAVLTEENVTMKKKLEEFEDRADFLDDQRRQVNLRFSGLQEDEGENWQQTQKKVSKIIQERMNMKPTFERVYRVGKASANRPRDIITQFSRIADRDAVLRDRRKLKGSNIFINEDFCPRTMEHRKEQMNAYHLARRNGKIAYFNYKTLVVKEPIAVSRTEEGATAYPVARTPTVSTPPRPRGTDGQTPGSTPPAWPKLGHGDNDRRQSVTSLNREGSGAPNTSNTGARGGSHFQRGSVRETRQHKGSNRQK